MEGLGQKFLEAVMIPGAGQVRANIAVCIQREGLPGYKRIEFYEGQATCIRPHDVLLFLCPVAGG
jgi:hypothetical protein